MTSYSSISEVSNRFSSLQIKQLMIQLLSAIEHMHSKWYIHRDLKTTNLLYNNKGYLSVCDFGLARKYGRYCERFEYIRPNIIF